MVKTDHYSLKYLLDQCLATIPQHQWVSKLMGFDFIVEYKPGASNTVANALSRHSVEESGELAALSAPSFIVFDTLHTELNEISALCNSEPRLQQVGAGTSGKWSTTSSPRPARSMCRSTRRTSL
jgi:hypothetical protein